MKPDEHIYWHRGMPLLLEIGEVDEYRRRRSQALKRFASARDSVADRIAKSCMMMSGDAAEMTRAASLADRAFADNPSKPWLWFCKGQAEYRCGHDEQALGWLAKIADNEEVHRKAAAEFYSAMAFKRLGRCAKAAEALHRGIEIMETKLPKAGDGDLSGTNFQDWILCDLACKEAEVMIFSKKSPTTRASIAATGPAPQ